MTTAQTCNMWGCDKPVRARGWCHMHHMRWVRHGDPNVLAYDKGKRRPKRKGASYCRLCYDAVHALGLCAMHYRRYQRYGDPFFDGSTYIECSVPGCYEAGKSRRMCPKHYHRWRRHGDPLGGPISNWGELLPLEPLAEAMDAMGGVGARARAMGWDEKEVNTFETQYRRALEDGAIDLTFADELCCKVLGLHPALIWPKDYWVDHNEPELEEAA